MSTEKEMKIEPDEGSSNQLADKEDYKAVILHELEMILKTVHQIDKNVITSVHLLRDTETHALTSIGKTNISALDYREVVLRNIETITSILKMLEDLD